MGFLWAIIAAFFWGLAPIFAKLGLVSAPPLAGLMIRTGGVALILLIISLVSGDWTALGRLDMRTWLFLLAEGISASLLGHYAYFYALKLGRASTVAPVVAACPLFAVLLAAVILREQLTAGKVAGVLLIVAGVLVIKRF